MKERNKKNSNKNIITTSNNGEEKLITLKRKANNKLTVVRIRKNNKISHIEEGEKHTRKTAIRTEYRQQVIRE